jgi:dienelactone hydrolase
VRLPYIPLHLHPLTSLDTTGPSDAKRGILLIYDIFGFFPQTLQGADILAYSDSEHPYQVFVPDFFEGRPADISWYPPDNKEKEEKLGKFFEEQGAPGKTVPRVPKIVQELGKSKGVEKWAVLGFCWGGKVRLSYLPSAPNLLPSSPITRYLVN